jgi:YrbI family 3-deoxy-D-manno-octulosonate 8-phosphate phosphatase
MVNFKKIKLIISDFDGVMTDNKVLIDENGKEAVFCNRSDGLGIEMLKKKTSVEIMVLSKEKNQLVEARCKKLKIECIYGIDQKYNIFINEIKKRNLDSSQVCYIGNDINDVGCIKAAGIGIAVADAHQSALKAAKYITKKKGGEGAVREVIDMILN